MFGESKHPKQCCKHTATHMEVDDLAPGKFFSSTSWESTSRASTREGFNIMRIDVSFINCIFFVSSSVFPEKHRFQNMYESSWGACPCKYMQMCYLRGDRVKKPSNKTHERKQWRGTTPRTHPLLKTPTRDVLGTLRPASAGHCVSGWRGIALLKNCKGTP